MALLQRKEMVVSAFENERFLLTSNDYLDQSKQPESL